MLTFIGIAYIIVLEVIFVRKEEHFMELLNGRIQEIPGVISTETLISLRQSIKKEVPVSVIS